MITLSINGTDVAFDGDPDTPLLWFLRDERGLTASKFGCGVAQCGACTVFLDGQPTRACVTPVSAVGAQKVTTLEGLAGPVIDAVRAAWQKHDVAQCGYCQSGQIMAATALLSANATPSDKDIDEAMAGNICRCATYVRIRAAIKTAAGALKG
jgi:isoquinoline 1-oxidoreductase alpha subunit